MTRDELEKLVMTLEGCVIETCNKGHTIAAISAFEEARYALLSAFDELSKDRDALLEAGRAIVGGIYSIQINNVPETRQIVILGSNLDKLKAAIKGR